MEKNGGVEMIKVKNKQHRIRISFNTKKVLNKLRKDKLKEVFNEFTIENKKEKMVAYNEDYKIIFTNQDIIFDGEQYNLITNYIPEVLRIFDVDPKSNQFYIELSLCILCNNEEDSMTPFQQAQVMSNFISSDKKDKKLITSVEFVTFMESMKNTLITTSFKMYNQGMAIRAIIILDKLEEFDKYFDNLETYLNISVLKSLKEDDK